MKRHQTHENLFLAVKVFEKTLFRNFIFTKCYEEIERKRKLSLKYFSMCTE